MKYKKRLWEKRNILGIKELLALFPLVTNVHIRNAVRKLQLPLPPPNGLTNYQNNPSFFITNSKKNKVK